jgi:DnaJ-class molecular chaperone
MGKWGRMKQICIKCNGKGIIVIHTCPPIPEKGVHFADEWDVIYGKNTEKICPRCGGTGEIWLEIEKY